MANLPTFPRAADLAGTVFPVSEAVILDAARRHGIGRRLGQITIFSQEGVYPLYEALPCHSSLSFDRDHRSGSSRPPSPASALKKKPFGWTGRMSISIVDM